MEKTNDDINNLIKLYELKPHEEGGRFAEIYKSTTIFLNQDKYSKEPKSICTLIYFLLTGAEISYWHKLKSDEIWHFYSGTTILIYTYDETNNNKKDYFLGDKLKDNRNEFTVLIKSGLWFGAKLLETRSYGFVGCSMSPGFEYKDFNLAQFNELEKKFPILEGLLNNKK